jgi:hypothetical protein
MTSSLEKPPPPTTNPITARTHMTGSAMNMLKMDARKEVETGMLMSTMRA